MSLAHTVTMPARHGRSLCMSDRIVVLWFLALLILVTSWLVVPARADFFTVNDISIDRTAESAVEARNAGLLAAQRQAWERLLERLVDPDAIATAPPPTQQQLGDLIYDFKIVAENRSTVRYLATIDYQFNADSVLAWLRNNNLPHISSQAALVLIIPVWRENDTVLLWEAENPWLQAWQGIPLINRAAPLILPHRNLDDILSLSPEQAASADTTAIAALAKRYGTIFYYISIAERNPESGNIDILTIGRGALGEVAYRERNLDAPQPQSAGAVTEIAATETAAIETAATAPDDTSQQAALLDAALALANSQQAVLHNAALALARRWDRDWRRANIGRQPAAAAKFEASLRFNNRETWPQLWRLLNNIDALNNLNITSFSTTGADITAVYAGSVEQLEATLAQHRLNLIRKNQRLWIEEIGS